jgi:hypothetical protein
MRSLILCNVSSEGRRVRPMTWTRALLSTAALACAVITTSAQSNPAPSSSTATAPANQMQDKATSPAQQTKTTNTKADGDYVGSDTCVTCHEDQGRRFNRTAMGKAMAHPHSPDEAHGCESCHGPGRAHVEAGGTKDSIPVRFTEDSKNTVAEKNFACNATPAETSFSGEAARTNRAPWLAWIATRRTRNFILHCPMRRALTRRSRKTKV